ncbi:hypothetical protein P4O66_007307, partial [Electrophorus voltai]
STSVESPEAGEGLRVPPEYSNLEQVFSPVKALQLPPHREWDCAITLKGDAVPPRCRVYPLFQEEDRIMAQYIKEALQQGYIRPSTSPASASVFFVKKKDGGLQPCVDYRGLNRLLVQYPSPLPLVPAALEQLRGAWWFIKLDLHNHPEATCTAQLLSARYRWPAVVRYVASCVGCARSKTPHTPPAGKLLPLPTHPQPWSHLAIDFVTGLPVSEGNMVVLVIVDRFSKMVRFLSLKDLPTAWEMAELLFHQVFQVFELPEDIVSDKGPQFTSKVWKELLGKLNITVSLTYGYHPQANGQVERANQELGFQSPLYSWNPPTSDQPAVEAWCRGSEQVWEGAHQKLLKAITTYKRKADRRRGETPLYEPGQKVGVSTVDGRVGSRGKLAARYEGPYTVMRHIDEVTFHVDLPRNIRASRAFNVLALQPVAEGPILEEASPSSAPPSPVRVGGGLAYKAASSEASTAAVGPATRQEAGGVFGEGSIM